MIQIRHNSRFEHGRPFIARTLLPNVQQLPLPWELKYKVHNRIIIGEITALMHEMYNTAFTLLSITYQRPQIFRDRYIASGPNWNIDAEENSKLHNLVDRELRRQAIKLDMYLDYIGVFYKSSELVDAICHRDLYLFHWENPSKWWPIDSMISSISVDSLVTHYMFLD